MLFEAFAENYMTDGLLSGVVTDRSSKAIQAPRSHSLDGDDGMHTWMRVPPPPVPPMISWRSQSSEKPPPPPLELDTASKLLSIVSLGIGGLMAFAFLLCAYCFFREDALRLLGISPKKGLNRKTYAVAPSSDPRSGRRGRDEARRKKEKCKGEKEDADNRKKRGAERTSEGYVNVRVETKALTQKKELYVADCDDVSALRKRIRDEFPSVLGGKKPSEMLLLCLERSTAETDEEQGAERWMLVLSASDIKQVIECEMLRMIERPAEHSDADYGHAFLAEGKKGKGSKGKKEKKAANGESISGTSGTMERFADTEFPE